MEKRWEEIEGYMVSNYGEIIGRRSKRPLKPYVSKGQAVVRLYIGNEGRGTVRSVAHLVAELFVPLPREDCRIVEHIDGDRLNNRADNLRWHVKKRK